MNPTRFLALAAAVAALALPSRVCADQILLPAGATWKYLDNGSDQGTAWRAAGFDDSGWAQGPAELGYGDGDEATIVGFGGNTTNRFITTYFRTTFNVPDPAAFVSLNLRLLRDDGAVVYLNGTEVRRDNMPTGTIASATLASSALGAPAEATFYSTGIPVSSLVAGTNTLAVEIHQANATSSDVSFNLELVGADTATVVRGPYLQQGTPTSMIVRWRTDVANVGRVAFGTAAGALTNAVDEASATTEHQVLLTGLTPNTQYFYSIGTPADVLASGPDHAFYTAPPVGSTQPTRIWLLGDAGTANADQAAVRNAYAAFSGSTYTDLMILLGDNAYNNGTDAEYQAAFFNMYPSFLRQTAVWSTIGNHDTASSTNPSLTIPYFQMFSLPTAGEAGGVPSGTEKYYSFDYANVHFVCLDSMTTSRSTNGAMSTWLQNDLASTTQQWIIAFWHHPPYTKGSHDSDVESQLVEMRQNLLPYLEAGGVDLVLCGHSHSYERSFLLNGHYGLSTSLVPSMKIDGGSGRPDGTGAYDKPGGNAANQGAVYITAGSSGKISGGSLNHPAMFTSLNNLGSVVLDVSGPQLDAKFLRENGTVADYFTITKNVPNAPPTVALTGPADGAVYTAPAEIGITATATDADGTVAQVDFYQGDTPIGSDSTAPFGLTWTGVTAGTYVITATATDNLGATVTSAPITFVVNVPPPGAPTDLAATAGNGQVSLTWTASAGAASYTVYRSTTGGGPRDVVATLAGTSCTDTNLTNGTAYFYVVTASNAGGESGDSNEVSATPQVPAPSAPTDLAATAGNGLVSLTWTASAEAASYTVYRSTTSGGGYAAITTVTAADYVDATVSNGTTYFYVVTASNAGGESTASNQASATPTAPPPAPPAAPSGLTATAVSKSQINLAWTDNSGNETGFKIERRMGNGAWSQITVTGANVGSFFSTGLQAGKTYSFRVRATNAGGDSAYSNIATASTPKR